MIIDAKPRNASFFPKSAAYKLEYEYFQIRQGVATLSIDNEGGLQDLSMYKFIHAADIHLDSPCRGLQRYESAPVEALRTATRAAFSNLIELAVKEQAEFLLLAGDLYDGDWKDYNTGLFMAAQMARLQRADIRVFIVTGNHDASSRITRHLAFPDNVTFFSTSQPESIALPNLNTVIHGQGFQSQTQTEDLAAGFPAPKPDGLNIGLLHTSLDGRPGHEPYAPTTMETLLSKGYDYWALGHVHKREVLSESPWIVFPGNLQGRHARETGPKGATVVCVENGIIADATHHDLDDVRWEVFEIDCSTIRNGGELLNHMHDTFETAANASDSRVLAVRIRLTGATEAHSELSGDLEHWINQIRANAIEASDRIWIEKVLLETTSPMDLDSLKSVDGPAGALARTLGELEAGDAASLDHPLWEDLKDTFHDLLRALPAEYHTLDDAIQWDDPASAATLIRDVKQLLLPRLFIEEERA